MITDVALGTNQLTTTKRFCVGTSGGSFPGVSYNAFDRGPSFGRKLSRIQARSFTILTEWVILGSSFADLVTERSSFIQLLGAILESGTATLKITRSNGTTLQIEVKAVKVTGAAKPEDGVSSPLLVEFEAEYPFFQSVEQYVSEIGLFAGGGMAIPMGIPMSMGVAGVAETTIVAGGNYPAYPLIKLIGVMDTPTLRNNTAGKQLTIAANLNTTGKFVLIDTFLRTVVNEAGSNVRGTHSGDFWTLAVGSNSIRLSATSGSSGKAIISYRNHHLNI